MSNHCFPLIFQNVSLQFVIEVTQLKISLDPGEEIYTVQHIIIIDQYMLFIVNWIN